MSDLHAGKCGELTPPRRWGGGGRLTKSSTGTVELTGANAYANGTIIHRVVYKGQDENFFLLMAQPPAHVVADQIPPRDYVFIVDVSGSMHGYPLEVSKKLLAGLARRLRQEDAKTR